MYNLQIISDSFIYWKFEKQHLSLLYNHTIRLGNGTNIFSSLAFILSFSHNIPSDHHCPMGFPSHHCRSPLNAHKFLSFSIPMGNLFKRGHSRIFRTRRCGSVLSSHTPVFDGPARLSKYRRSVRTSFSNLEYPLGTLVPIPNTDKEKLSYNFRNFKFGNHSNAESSLIPSQWINFTISRCSNL